MAHECLVMSDRPGPIITYASAGSPVLAIYPEWRVLIPAGSWYPGKTMRIRASGICAGDQAMASFRIAAGFSLTYQGADVPLHAVFGMSVSNHGQNVPWRLDYTFVCRSTSSTVTTLFPMALFVSPMIISGNPSPSVNCPMLNPDWSAPVVSTGTLNANVDQLLGIDVHVQTSTVSLMFQTLSYRVDAIA